MKRFWNIVLCVLSVVPLIAQEDYYFTLLDHWNWKGPNTYVPTNLKKCAVSLCAAEDVDFTFSTPVNNGQTTIHVNQGNNSVVMIDDVDAAILNGVSIHSSGASSININIIGTTSAAETAVLPKRLLGTKYMVQGAPGLLVDNLPVYSQFTVVGIENGSSIRVKPRVAMTCVTTGATVPAGQVSNFQINEKQVLLFQPVNYEDEISGTVVESDRKIAVFQGNNITRISVTANWSDFVYEQARPISSWGKEFIIPKASGLIICDWKIIAAEDNTEVYIYANGSKVKHGVKNAGEWFTKTIYSASSDLQVDHIVTSKPVCCYLYMTGSSSNNSKGDPEMIEIVPVDKMATEARWGKAQTNDNTPHTISLLVTAPQADETKVQYNSQPLSSYATQSGVQRAVIDGFVVYQIPFAVANGVLHSDGEGFCAHIIHYAKTAEGTGYNVSLPEEMPELYDIIVNKYNWQLLCHNVRVRELFPELTVTGYQWYKDGTAIPNATEDDYSEQNELQGAFQLRLLMSDGRYVWSEILTIQPAQTLTPNRIRVYNHNGTLIYQSETETTLPYLPKGLYIIQIEQNGEQRIEKKLIP